MNKFAILKAILITVLFVVSTSMYAQLKNFGVTFTKRATIMSIHEILDPPAEHKVKNTKVEIGYAGSDEQDLAQTGIYGMFYINDADLNIKSNFYDSDEDNEISISIVVYDIQGGSDDTHAFLCSGMLIEDYIYLGLKSEEGFDVSDDINRIYIIVSYDDSSAEPITVLIKEGELEIEDGDIEGPMTAYFSFDITDNGSGSRSSYDTKSSTGYLNGHQWVDLGLPSETKWATCNVGASSYNELGDYFAFGEVSAKNLFYPENHAFSELKGEIVHDITRQKLPPSISHTKYDAASANWGTSWRLPTKTEFIELYTQCKVTRDGNLLKFTGPNGNFIYLNMGGYRFRDRRFELNECCIYWTGTSSGRNMSEPNSFSFDGENTDVSIISTYCGALIRPVTNR